ncbi:MAG: DMT family transporter [Hyphomicrobiaceae bacterium]
MTEATTLAAVLALSASFVFGVSNHVQHVALDHMDVRAGTLVNVGTTALILWLLSPFFLVPETLLSPSAGWFAMAGLIVPSLSMTLHTMSIRTIGPGLTSGLASTSPFFAIAIAVGVFGEVVTGQALVGTAIVVLGIAFIALRARSLDVDWSIVAMMLPLAAALTRALAQNVIKFGMNDLPSPLTAALVGATSSLLVLLVAHVGSGRRLPRWGPGYGWFGLCGIMNGLGIVGSYVALDLSGVVVVSPLISCSPAFTLLTGWLFFRRETVQWANVWAIFFIFCGCLLIVLR